MSELEAVCKVVVAVLVVGAVVVVGVAMFIDDEN